MSIAIGIDLGTTFSCASIYRKGRSELIPNTEGDRLTPSMVYFDPMNGEVSVGQIAYELSPHCPGNCLQGKKHSLPRKNLSSNLLFQMPNDLSEGSMSTTSS